MKKFLVLAVMFLLVFALVPAANAGPAPALSRAYIHGAGLDANQYWIYRNSGGVGLGNLLNEKNPIVGDTIFLYVEYTGYYGSATIYQSSKVIPAKHIKITKREYITNSGGIVTGSYITYSIKRSGLPGKKTGNIGQLYIKASGLNGGSAYDTLANIYVK